MTTLSALFTLVALAAPVSPQDGSAVVPVSRLEDLGRAVAAYAHARAVASDVDAAREAVRGELEGLASAGIDILARPADLSRALELARDLDAFKGLRGTVEEHVVQAPSFAGRELELAYRLPEDYDPDDHAYPLVLAIPDTDERVADHVRDHFGSRELKDGAIVVCCGMPEEEASWERITHGGRAGGLAHALTALRFATTSFRVDPDRVFVAGRGRGVPSAFAVANHTPDRFAGVLARAGELEAFDGGPAPGNFVNLPLFLAAVGDGARSFLSEVEALGGPDGSFAAADDDEAVWPWIATTERIPYPATVRVHTGSPFPTRVGWLRVAPSAPGANATGTIDRAEGVVTIETEGVSGVTLYLNDTLVDLSRPLTVTCDGTPRELHPLRSQSALLALLEDGTSDIGRVYVSRATLDLRPGAQDFQVQLELAISRDLDSFLGPVGDDAEALWELAESWLGTGQDAWGHVALSKLLRLDPDHAQAREAAGWFGADGQWFRTRTAHERFLRSQDPEIAAARGHVLHRGAWIHPDERVHANRGWTKDFGRGLWLSGTERRRLLEGWCLQDLTWIEPEKAHRTDRREWLVGDEWVDLATAEAHHADLSDPWRIPAGPVILNTTLDRATAWRAAEHAGRAIEDLQLVFGAQPVLPIEVTVLRDEEQVDRLAFGSPDGSRPPTHVGRLHTIHSAFLAERWFRYAGGELEHAAQGVGLWDVTVPHGDAYGVHATRLATGLSYVDALDPSPKAVRRALAKGVGTDFVDRHAREKKLPEWLRWGGAVYAERFFRDPDAPADGDPFWARAWSLENLAALGGLRELEHVLAFELDPDDREESRRLLLEVGLLVAFLVDGDCEAARDALAVFQRAMIAGDLHPNGVRALEQVLLTHEIELRAFGC